MKVIVFLASLLITVNVFAITPERTQELQSEAQKLLEAKQVRLGEINQIDTRLIEIQGIFKESQEKPKEE